MKSGWRFCWVGVSAELATTGSSGAAEEMVSPPKHRTKISRDTLLLNWPLKPAPFWLLWSVVRPTVLSPHLQLPCPPNIFNAMKWGGVEGVEMKWNLTSMVWVAWSGGCVALEIWHWCGHWGNKIGCAKCPSVLMATGWNTALLVYASVKKRPSNECLPVGCSVSGTCVFTSGAADAGFGFVTEKNPQPNSNAPFKAL